MTVDDVEKEIRLAIRVLRWMPCDGPARVKAVWPEYLHTERDNWWASESATNETRILPSAKDIARMDVVLFEWFPQLSDDERVLLSARGSGMSWRRIMRIRQKLHSRSHVGQRQAWQKVIRKIASWPSVRAA